MQKVKELALTIHREYVDLRQTAAWLAIVGVYVYAIVAFCT